MKYSTPTQTPTVPRTSPDLPVSAPPSETLYADSDAYFESMISGLNGARFQVELEAYIYESGEIGQRFLFALTNAAKRGVQVRLMVDGAGIQDDFTVIARQLVEHDVQLRIYRPLPWRLDHWKFSLISSKGLKKFWRLLSDINHRNHRKMLIVDHQKIWLGSMNISQAHLSLQQGGLGWRDTAISVSSGDLRLPVEAFDMTWNRSRRSHRKTVARQSRRSPFFFNFTRGLRLTHYRKLLARIDKAQNRIWVTNAYFAPDNTLIKKLEAAAARDVDVRILLPKRSDVFFMPWVSSIFYQRLIEAGVRVYEYLPSMLHAKTILIDHWATVGSSNLNKRSLIHDLEVDYALQSDTNVTLLASFFEHDIEQALELDYTMLASKKRWHRWLGLLVILLLGNWL